MKKNLLKIVIIAGLSVSANATCSALGCYDVLVKKIYILPTGDMYVQTSGDHTQLNCTRNPKLIKLVKSDGQKSIYSALLTAQTTNKKVDLRINQGSSDCSLAYYVAR